MYEDRYWPVFVARYNDLPIRIRNGQTTADAKEMLFPYSIKALDLSEMYFSVDGTSCLCRN